MGLILVKFGRDREIARTLFDISTADDDVLLIQDGVLWLMDNGMIQEVAGKQVHLYAMKEDLVARGYSEETEEAVQIIDYAAVIDLIAKNEQIIG